jgi:hypothetical protein
LVRKNEIKILAQVITWIGIMGSIITGFALITQGTVNYYGSGVLVGAGIGVLIGGSIISWISSWFLYGFGELIEYVAAIYDKLDKKEKDNTTLTDWKNNL